MSGGLHVGVAHRLEAVRKALRPDRDLHSRNKGAPA